MGVSVSVSCTPYEGRVIRLTAEQLRYENGQSYVAWRIDSTGGAASYYGIGPITAVIDGRAVYTKGVSYYSGASTASFPVAKGSVNGSLWISHTGSKTVTISLSTYVYMDTGGSPFTASLTLPGSGAEEGGGEEEKATPIALVTGGDIGGKCTVSFVPDWEGCHYRISYQAGDSTYAWDVHPQSSRKQVDAAIPLVYELAQGLQTQGSLTLRLATYRSSAMNAASLVGTSTWVLTIRVVEDDQTRPRVTGLRLSPSPDVLDGACLQNKTGILGQVTGEGRYGAAIRRLWFRVEGRDYGTGEVSALLNQYGSLTVLAYATDSRGFTSLGYPVTVEVLPYFLPRLRPIEGQSRVAAVRCGSTGIPQENGAWVILKVRREYSPLVMDGVQKNFCTLRYRYRADSAQGWSAWSTLLAANASGDSVTTQPLIGTLAPQSAYQVEIQASDTLGSTASTVLALYSDRIYWHRSGSLGSLGFGKYVQEADVFDIAPDKTLKVRGGLALQGDAYTYLLDLCHPIGSVLESTREADPASYLGGSWEVSSQTGSTTKWRRIA